jgi:pyruvate/2-oxoglutarate dehydrogenase complex dihydrolipoamide dehydrogenase (E3) component
MSIGEPRYYQRQVEHTWRKKGFGIKVDGYAIEFEKIVQRVNSIIDKNCQLAAVFKIQGD